MLTQCIVFIDLEKLEIEKAPGQKSSQQPVANAVDGSLSTCSMTSATTDPWLRLQSIYSFTVCSVAITNKQASPSDLDNVHIKVGNTDTNRGGSYNALCYTVAHIPAGQTVSYPCANKLSGRFVVVWLYGANRILSLCEIVVYGERYQGESMCNVCLYDVKSSFLFLRLYDVKSSLSLLHCSYESLSYKRL